MRYTGVGAQLEDFDTLVGEVLCNKVRTTTRIFDGGDKNMIYHAEYSPSLWTIYALFASHYSLNTMYPLPIPIML